MKRTASARMQHDRATACHHGRQVAAIGAAGKPRRAAAHRDGDQEEDTEANARRDRNSGVEHMLAISLAALPPAFEIGRLHLRPLQQLAAAAAQRDARR